ncbi:PhnD/SsuA/transferrin family substrate-binding protein [bacterium]|nr:PhnD/SsuA/transferrin family substrate-binding protein [bacterium]
MRREVKQPALLFMLVILCLGFITLSVAAQARESIPLVMFGPDVDESREEVLSGLQPFVEYLNVRLPFDLEPYFYKSKDRLNKFFKEKKAGFALLELSYFLEYHRQRQFVPLLKPVVNDSDTFQLALVVRKKGGIKSVSALKSQRLSTAGNYSGTLKFYSRIALKRELDLQHDCRIQHAPSASAAMIEVMHKKASAAIVWKSEFDIMCELNPAARRDLCLLYASEAYAFHPLVYVKNRVTTEQAEALRKELIAQVKSAEGRQLLMIFRYEGWGEVRPGEFQALIKAWK